MSWILYVLLVLAVAGDILLAVVLAKVMHKNDEPQQKIDTADDFVRAVTPVLQSETDLLAEQLRAMQGELGCFLGVRGALCGSRLRGRGHVRL